MGLISSVAEAEAIRRQGTARNSSLGTADTSFRDVLKNGLSGVSESMDAIFEEAADKFGLSSNLIKAVAKAESNFNPDAVSHAGAMGVMQLMPGTAKGLGVSDPFDARQNIMGGAKYLRENLDRFGGNVSLALAAYNAGPNSVQKYGGIPPYEETQNYVKKVTSYINGSSIYADKNVVTGQLGSAGNSYLGSGLASSYNTAGIYGGSQSLGTMSLMGGMSGDFMNSLAVSQDGDTITMDKESFNSLIQILRIQMMMNASKEVGTITI